MAASCWARIAGGMFVLATSGALCGGANFAPISGSLAIQAGGKAAKTTPVVIGAASLTDNSFPDGVDFAAASLIAATPTASRFTFSGSASSSTNAAAPSGQTNATATVEFQQSFTTTAQQWIELAGDVLSPPSEPNIFATLRLARLGQPAPIFTLGDTAGTRALRQALAAPGVYTLTGSIDTTAPTPGSFAGALSGYVLVARVGDFNGDSIVNAPDLAAWKTGFGSTAGTFASGDLDDDSHVDGADYLLWQRQFGTHTSAMAAAAAVPEPASAVLWAAALWAIFRRRPHGGVG
ncbi:MAG: hypothetical protein IT424_00405 [Pirellulales bacterium]|nr:hypothetical protein [Pirellulales bacterium]